MLLETFLDVLLIEEVPEENERGTGIKNLAGQEIVRTEASMGRPSLGRVLSCGERFPMSGVWVDMPYKVGDLVTTNEYGRNYEIALNKGKHGREAKYFLVHYADVEGRIKAETLTYSWSGMVDVRA